MYNEYGDAMEIQIQDVNIHYVRYGAKTNPIVFLHGWGQNIEMMQPVAQPLQENHEIIILDLPGYGKSSEPIFSWTVEDYVECIHTFLSKLKIENPIFVGHSFGGKVSLLYASKYAVSKMVLFASPFKKEIEKLSLKTKTLKTLKKVPGLKKFEEFAKKHIGSTDYRNASPRMREILVHTVNLDITEDVKKIKCPTLLVWGTLDEAVPVERAYELEALIEDAGVVIYENKTHYAYLEDLRKTISILHNFFD